MKKRLFVLPLLLLLLLPVLCLSAQAGTPRLVDNAELLSSAEKALLLKKLDAASDEYGFDFVIVTVNSLEGRTEKSFADSYYDQNGFRPDGIVLLIDMGTRAYYESTSGDGIAYFDDYYYDLEDEFTDALSYGDYAAAFSGFLRKAEDIVKEGRELARYSEMPVGEKIRYRITHLPAWVFVVSIGGALLVAIIMTVRERRKLDSVAMQKNATGYVQGGLDLTQSKDIFLYSTVTKVKISSNSGGGRSFGGGHSSGGHGGHGGHF